MADKKDELRARRWFRRRLAELASRYPHLRSRPHQERLTEALTQEQTPCPENPQETPGDGHEGQDISTHHNE